MSKVTQIKEITELLNQTEYRDKFLKLFQNVLLWESYMYTNQDKKYSDNLFLIYQQIYISRRLFRFGKTLEMINNIIMHKNKPGSINNINAILVNIFFSAYYLSENITVLVRIGFIPKSIEKYHILKMLTHGFWTLGLCVQLIYYLYRLRHNFRKEGELRNQLSNGMETQEFIDHLQLYTMERQQFGFIILRILGDMICSTQKLGLPEKYLHVRFNKGLVAMGGILSSILRLNQLTVK